MDDIDTRAKAIASQFLPLFHANGEAHAQSLANAIAGELRAERLTIAAKAEQVGEEALQALRRIR